MVDTADDAEQGLASVEDLLEALIPSATRLEAILKSKALDDDRKRTTVAQAYFKAASSGNSELLEWLLTPANPARRFIDLEARDPDGSPAIVLAAVFGHGDVIRVLSEHGADINATDAKGWSSLHWSIQNGNLPLSSFLINRRASTSLRSQTGLAAVDLIRKGSQGEVFRDVARELADEAQSTASSLSGHDKNSTSRPASLPDDPKQARNMRRSKHTSLPVMSYSGQNLQKEERLRMEMAMKSARNLDIDFSLLAMEPADDSQQQPAVQEEDDEGSELLQDVEAADAPAFDWNECLPDQMIGFSLQDLPALLDTAIEVKPSRSTKQRFLPANVVFLAARFASRFGGEDLLGELMIGAIDRIEANIHAHADDLAHSAYWLSNAMLLVHFLKRDTHTGETTLEYQENLYDLIRAISAFCVRSTERRLDRILDSALLDHEPLPGYEDIRFEDEWRLLKALTSRGKKDASLSASPALRPSVLGLFGTPDRTFSSSHTSSPSSKPGPPGRMRTPSMPTLRSTFGMAPATPPSTSQPDASPRDVTAILSSTLFVLQHYDYAGHPAVVLQIFSQLLYWLASELFNRILTKKRYLCRSRALQIRLNVSSLEDWARTNRLPTAMVNAHFRPVNELLQWLQCLSSESSIDGLLATMQNLQTLNPLQMRRAVREYRYEVDESKISEECTQYLAQLQKDWERRRLLQGLDNAAREAERRASTSTSTSSSGLDEDDSYSVSLHSNESSRTSDPRPLGENPIHETLAAYKWDISTYEPPERPPCFDELLDSRVILPFVPPPMDQTLQHASHSFGPLAPSSKSPIPSQSDHMTRSASSQPALTLSFPTPAVPEDFLDRLQEANAYYSADVYPVEHSHQPSKALEMPAGQDYWLNWRERWETELSMLEEQDAASIEDNSS